MVPYWKAPLKTYTISDKQNIPYPLNHTKKSWSDLKANEIVPCYIKNDRVNI